MCVNWKYFSQYIGSPHISLVLHQILHLLMQPNPSKRILPIRQDCHPHHWLYSLANSGLGYTRPHGTWSADRSYSLWSKWSTTHYHHGVSSMLGIGKISSSWKRLCTWTWFLQTEVSNTSHQPTSVFSSQSCTNHSWIPGEWACGYFDARYECNHFVRSPLLLFLGQLLSQWSSFCQSSALYLYWRRRSSHCFFLRVPKSSTISW